MRLLSTLFRAGAWRLAAAAATALLPLTARAQLTITAGSQLTVSSGSMVAVTGAVLNAGTLTNEGLVQLTGDLTSPGTISGANGLWKLTGSTTAQALNVSSLLPSLEILNPQGATLAAALRVRALLLTSGGLRLGAHTLTSTVGGSIAGVDGSAGRFIITNGAGLLEQYVGSTASLFPVGPTTARYTPATLTRSLGSTDLYGLRAAPHMLAGGSTGTPRTTDAVALHWELAPPDAVPFALEVSWQAADELPGFDRALSALARWTGVAYLPVETFGPAVGSGPYTRSGSALVGAGPYVVLDQQAPLPVQLTRFSAQRPAGQARVELRWETAQELNSAGFEVQRQDAGQTGFRRVGYLAAQGTSSTTHSYALTDPNDFAGLSYYRLRQLDLDGTETYSAVQAVAGLPAGARFSLSAFPNPVPPGTSLTLEATGPVPPGLTLTLYAADGRRVRELPTPTATSGRALLPLNLPQGTYWLRYQAPDGTRGTLPVVVGE